MCIILCTYQQHFTSSHNLKVGARTLWASRIAASRSCRFFSRAASSWSRIEMAAASSSSCDAAGAGLYR